MLYTMHYILSKSSYSIVCVKKKKTQIITELLLESQMERTKFMWLSKGIFNNRDLS